MTDRLAETADLAKTLFQPAISIEPQNSQWHRAPAYFYARQFEVAGSGREVLARNAMAEFNAHAALDPTAFSDKQAPQYAIVAIEVGELDKAQPYAERCLAELPKLAVKDSGSV